MEAQQVYHVASAAFRIYFSIQFLGYGMRIWMVITCSIGMSNCTSECIPGLNQVPEKNDVVCRSWSSAVKK
jgi:hypothetical protein